MSDKQPIDFYKNEISYMDSYITDGVGGAVIRLMGGGKLLVRKPDDIKKPSWEIADVPEGQLFTGGGLVMVSPPWESSGSARAIYVNDINARLVELFGIGLMMEGNFIKMCSRSDWESNDIHIFYQYQYPRIVDAVYMQLLGSGEPMYACLGKVYHTEHNDSGRKFVSEEKLCVKCGDLMIAVDDLIACANWMGDVFNYDVSTKAVTIKPRPELTEEEE